MSRTALILNEALAWAERGFPVGPTWGVHTDGRCRCEFGASCSSTGKHPKGLANGLRGFSTTRDTIERWAEGGRWEQQNLGVAIPQGYLVLDVDGEQGVEELVKLQEVYGALPRSETLRTGSGGWHVLFGVPEGHSAGNGTRGLRDAGAMKIDVRSSGAGYIVVAPSTHSSGGVYERVTGPETLAQLDSGTWLDLLAPKVSERVITPTKSYEGEGIGSKRGLGLLNKALRTLHAAEDRTNTLYTVSLWVGSFIKAGELDEEAAYDALHQAMLDVGLRESKATTIERAFDRADAGYVT